MRLLPDSVEKKGWVIALAVAAGLGLVADDAFADRPRHNSSSARQQRHFQQPRHHVQSRHHVQPRHHYHSHVPRIVVVPSYAPRRYYYVPAPVYVAPPVIIAPPVVPSTSSGYWYFCPDSRTYYPYVLDCASGWLAVVPGAPGPTN